jgi:hypothetical protein
MDTSEGLGLIEIVIIIASIVITIMLIIAVLAIPRIAKYHKATMKLTALMAKQVGVDKDAVQQVLNETGEKIDYNFLKELSS